MNIRKIVLVLICLFIFSGCTIENISNTDITKNVDLILNKKLKYSNTNAIGYQYYLPSYMSVIDVNDFNQELYYKGNIFYLYADVVSYYNKVENEYEEDKDAYISKKLNYGKKRGYLEVNEDNNGYYIEMMYNYVKVEGYSNKYDLVDSISSIAYILSSVKYNDEVIKTLIGDNKNELGDNETYNIFDTKDSNSSNFSNYINEYDNYTGSSNDASNLMEKEDTASDKKED